MLKDDPLPWLLEDETPVVRHLALRQLLDLPEDALEVRQARAAAMQTDPIASILAAQHPAGFWVKPGPGADWNRPELRTLEVPAATGVGQVRSLARLYSVFATGGQELGIPPDTLAALMAPARPPRGGSRDVVLQVETAYSLGFMKPRADFRFGTSEHAFGEPGAGGSFAFADPDAQVGYAYAMQDDPREKALRDTFYRCLHERQEFRV
jgi:CubicO group peptidase (beta-lactamase class C family)